MKSFILLFAAAGAVYAQSSCSGPSPSGSIRPSVASGYHLQVVATGLAEPRGIVLDTAGNLLVVESGSGVISAHTLQEANGCVTVASSKNVVDAMKLNHGIALSEDGKTLYASSSSEAWSWNYDSSSKAATGQRLLVANMSGSDHTTRTLLLSRQVPGMLIVARGSTSNIDIDAASIDSGHSQVKGFQLNDLGSGDSAYDYTANGTLLGWGLRNEVGLAEHPNTGGIYGVENSADQITRMGVDVHEDNPAEELNFFGYVNGSDSPQLGRNFGYPWCFTAWRPADLPDNANITVGDQFAIDATTASNNRNQSDAYCAEQVAPRLSFQAHMAPLDIKFNNSGSEAWITFHGSWDRTEPAGYKLSVVQFRNGEPVDPPNSTTAATDIVSNADTSVCPDKCMRPVAMAIDSHGRIFMSSDASGEIYLITRTSSTSSSGPSSSPTGSSMAVSLSGRRLAIGSASVFTLLAYLVF